MLLPWFGRILRESAGIRPPPERTGAGWRWAVFAANAVMLVASSCQMSSVLAATPSENQPDRGQPDMPDQQPENTPGEPDRSTPDTPSSESAMMIADTVAAEGDRELVFAVRLSRAGGAALAVQYATEDGTAAAGIDYQAALGSLTFPAYSTAARMVTVTIHDDAVDETDETFLVRVSSVPGAVQQASAVATGTIVDNDARSVIVRPAVLNVTEGQTARYSVVLGSRPTAPVLVTPAAPAEISVDPPELRFAPSYWATAQTVTVTAAHDDDGLADPAAEVTHTVRGGGYGGAPAGSVVATIVEDDAPTLSVAAVMAPEQMRTATFEVKLSLASDHRVTVDYATGGGTAVEGSDYAGARGELVFPAGSTASREIELTVYDDALDEEDEQFTVTLSNPEHATLAGGGNTATATATIEDDDAPPELTIADASGPEDAGTLAFPVQLDRASGRVVTVRYATAGVTAVADTDYAPVSGTLTFRPGAALVQTVSVPVVDDALDEQDEHFTVMLAASVHATLDASGRTATGTIRDDDESSQLAVADASLTESTEAQEMNFEVTLQPASGHLVALAYETEDGSATAGEDYTPASGTLTFAAGTTARTIAVTILTDQVVEDAETFTLTLSNPRGATLGVGSATGTIADQPTPAPMDSLTPPPTLASLQVTGAGTVYPEFDAGIHHYAVTCADSTTVQVSAQAHRTDITVTLLRANTNDSITSTGSVSAQLTVDGDHDIAVELSADGAIGTYVVHCVPAEFPAIKILKKTEGAAGGLLFVTPQVYTARYNFPHRYLAIIDYNGVPRYTSGSAIQHFNFRPYSDGPLIAGKRVRYSHGWAVLLDENLSRIRSVSTPSANPHDFLITKDATFLFVVYKNATRNFASFRDQNDVPLPLLARVEDSVIREVNVAGETVFEWNSFDHRNDMMVEPDCRLSSRLGGAGNLDYAHLNSVQIVDGDIVASFKGCNQVLRIDRSSGTGAIEWKIGGSSPPSGSAAQFLPIVDDDDVATNDEICAQHHATVTDSGSVLLFDNGDGCNGARKTLPQFTRVVEFDISSGTQASRLREYQLPDEQGYADFAGGVIELGNGNWLVTWGRTGGATAAADQLISISEVDPDAAQSVFEMNMSKSPHFVTSYRVYHESEDNVRVPLNLP